MLRELLKLKPRRYCCPFCGEWHGWQLSHELGYYNSACNKAELTCKREIYDSYSNRKMFIYFYDDYCYYETIPTCTRGYLEIKDKIPIEDIVESSKRHSVTFTVPFITKYNVGKDKCEICDGRDTCLMCKLEDEKGSQCMHITFGFEFDKSDYNGSAILKAKIATLNAKIATFERQEKELQERERVIESKELALKKCEDAVDSNEQVSQQPQVKENKEDITMANNIFNLNMEFGPNKDGNIASTIMGIAVKNGDSWRIYDKKKKKITDVGDMQLGNLPIYIMPTIKLSEGDLIKDNGEYYFVTNIATNSTSIQTLSARTGEMKMVVPINNIMGFSCYSKVIALSDSLNMGDDLDMEKLVIMSAMCGQSGDNGGQMNQLLPLILFKDKFVEDNDTMKLLLMSFLMNSKGENDQINQLLPLMLLKKDKPNDYDEKTKLLLISSMMCGSQAGSNNPMLNYLILDTFMSKKDDSTPKADGTAYNGELSKSDRLMNYLN